MTKKLPCLALLVLVLATPNVWGACVIGDTSTNRQVSALLCHILGDQGIVRAVTTYSKTRGVMVAAVYFDEGPSLEIIANPEQTAVVDSLKALVPQLEAVAAAAGLKPRSVRFAVFSTEETSVRPRLTIARPGPGQPVKIVSVTDGILEKPLPKASPASR